MQAAERELRELRALNAELESSIQSKWKKECDILNSKAQILEQQLNTENVERSNLQRNQRRLEKRMAEMNAQLEEERRTTNQFKEEVSYYFKCKYLIILVFSRNAATPNCVNIAVRLVNLRKKLQEKGQKLVDCNVNWTTWINEKEWSQQKHNNAAIYRSFQCTFKL